LPENPYKQGLSDTVRYENRRQLPNYKTAALPLSYAGICCAFNGLQIAALEHSDNLGRKLAQSLNAQTFSSSSRLARLLIRRVSAFS
jgi:hypothetical protein